MGVLSNPPYTSTTTRPTPHNSRRTDTHAHRNWVPLALAPHASSPSSHCLAPAPKSIDVSPTNGQRLYHRRYTSSETWTEQPLTPPPQRFSAGPEGTRHRVLSANKRVRVKHGKLKKRRAAAGGAAPFLMASWLISECLPRSTSWM